MIDPDTISKAAPWATGEDLSALVAGLRDAGRDWPDVAVPVEVAVEYIRARWEASSEVARSPARVRDLYFACACAAGDPGALRHFDAEVLGQARAALGRMRQGDDFVDEALQRAREHLLVGGEGGPRIATYGGAGSLPGWARVVVVRLALQMVRQRGPEDEADDAAPDPAGKDIEHQAVQGQYGAWLKRCIEDALATLEPADREILDLLFREELSMSEVGARLGVDKSTVSRRVTAIRTQVFDRLQRQARDELRLGGTEYKSLVHQLRSQLDITLGVLGRPR